MKTNIRRAVSFLLCCMLLTGVIFCASATDIAGGNTVWSFDEATGTLTVSGEGVMYDYDGVDYRPWAGYMHQVSSIVIEEGVTALGRNVFFDCSVETVTFPSTLLRIAPGAFKNCPDLTGVDLSGTAVRCIEKQAFANCPSLTTVKLPSSIPGGICYDVFNGCPALENVDADGNSALAARVEEQARQSAKRPVYPVQFSYRTYTDAEGNQVTELLEGGEVIQSETVFAATGNIHRIYYFQGAPICIEDYDSSGTLIYSWTA